MFVRQVSAVFRRIPAYVASRAFFYVVLSILAFSSIWVAVLSLYPMAFDEDFHFGIIKIYADMWMPFSIHQTPDMAVYGSLVTDASYLFHYLMSFPYRSLSAITSNEAAIVIVLRLLNVACLVGAVAVFRKVLLESKVSAAVTHGVLAVFTLIPVVPLLAGQINYDNPLLLIAALCLLLAIRARAALLARRHVPVATIYWLSILLLVGVGMKYAYLPIAVGIVLYVGFYLVRAWRAQRDIWQKCWQTIRAISWKIAVPCAVLLAICLALGSYRYISNVVQYHDPVPDCGAVLTVEECSQYGPWGRDYRLHQALEGSEEVRNLPHYTTTHWAWGMWHRLFFTLAGPTNNYATRTQLPVISTSAIIIAAVASILFVLYARRIFRNYPVFWLFSIVTVIYIAALLVQQYGLYTYTASPVAINGRYLLLLLPVLGAMLAVACVYGLRAIRADRFAGALFVVVCLVFLQGGGVLTYIVRSEPAWFWQNAFVQHVTDGARAVVKPVILE